MSGVRIGESSVETLVIVTDKAKSPLDMKVMTLEEVPPGQVPTKTTPAVRAGSKIKTTISQSKSQEHDKILGADTDKNIDRPL